MPCVYPFQAAWRPSLTQPSYVVDQSHRRYGFRRAKSRGQHRLSVSRDRFPNSIGITETDYSRLWSSVYPNPLKFSLLSAFPSRLRNCFPDLPKTLSPMSVDTMRT
jgi:hypothetical protein